MLEEFRIIGEADIRTVADLDELADKICALFTEDCILEDTSTVDVVRGRGELHQYSKSLFGPYTNVRIEAKEIHDTGNVSVMVLEISGDHTGELYGVPATGRRVSYPAIAIYRCNADNSLVRHETLSYDTGFIKQQLR
jgi:predicted ester cyclase